MAARVSTRVVVLGGGVGGLAAARHLERLFRDRADTEIVLVSRDNFFLLSPLLFETCSGVLVRQCVQPIRPCLRHARFIKATDSCPVFPFGALRVVPDRRTGAAHPRSSGRTKIVGDAITGRSLARGTRRTLEPIGATLESSASVTAMQ